MGSKRKRKSTSPNAPEPHKKVKLTIPPVPKSAAPQKPVTTASDSSNLPPSEFHPLLSLYYNQSTNYHLLPLHSYLHYRLSQTKSTTTDPLTLTSTRKAIKKLRKVLATAQPTDALRNLLETTLIAFKVGEANGEEPDGTQVGDETFASSGGSSIGNTSIGELVSHATKALYSRAAATTADNNWEAWKRRNVLLQGYGNGGGRGAWDGRGDGTVGGEAWERLVKVCGEAVVWEMLVNTSVFVGAGGRGVVQVTGVPVGEMPTAVEGNPGTKRKASPGVEGAVVVRKKAKVEQFDMRRKMRPKRTPGEIAFVRMRMFFGRPSFTKRMEVKHGFKNHHVLNRFNKADNRTHVIHVMKYIFPWQFGLHNVFCSDVNKFKTTQPFMDYTYRSEIDLEVPNEAEGGVSLRKQIIPKRLVKVEGLVEMIMRRNRKIKYALLLKHHCPSSLLDGGSPGSQLEMPATPSAINLVEHATSHSQVIKYVLSIIQHLVPLGFFGTLRNLREVQKAIGRFIHLRKFETMTLHTLSQNIDIKPIAWLGPTIPKMNITDFEKRRELLLEFLYWLMDSLVIPLIANTFYVTDISDNTDKRLLYFRQDVWRQLNLSITTDLKMKMFTPLSQEEPQLQVIQKPKSLIPPATFRIVPKLGKGYRIITNMRRRQTMPNGTLGPAPNMVLKPVLPILRYYRDRNKRFMMGASMDSPSDFFPRVAEFKSRLKSKGLWKQPGTKLYFVKLDIRKCYDTIPAERLLEYLQEILMGGVKEGVGKAFTIHPYTKVTPSTGSTNRKFTSYARPATRNTSFLQDITGLSSDHTAPTRTQAAPLPHVSKATKTKATLFIPNPSRKPQIHQLSKVLDILKEHLTSHTVKIGRKLYRQTRGIPQGSILSSLLVNLFYAKMEREELGFTSGHHFAEGEGESLLTRYVDDFLLITTSLSTAETFLDTLLPGLPAYGASTHPEKALCNFQNRHNIPVHKYRFFPYIGLDVNTQDLSINITHRSNSKSNPTTTKSKISVPTAHPISGLAAKLLKGVAFKYLDSRYTSTALNSSAAIRRNMGLIWMDLARQARAYLGQLLPDYRRTGGVGRFRDRVKAEKVVDELVRGAKEVLGRKIRGDRGWVGRIGEKMVRRIVFCEDEKKKGRRKGKWRLRELRRAKGGEV